ncbi:MAG: hypothetical protein CM15mP49_17200 [Actinomycetota bacterium]|nr:MAG: hypothetical protein CM15mP49_17200 [Actinomycetota bacterium]
MRYRALAETSKQFNQIMDEDKYNMAPMWESLKSPALSGVPISYQERRIWHLHEEIDRKIGYQNIPNELLMDQVLEPHLEGKHVQLSRYLPHRYSCPNLEEAMHEMGSSLDITWAEPVHTEAQSVWTPSEGQQNFRLNLSILVKVHNILNSLKGQLIQSGTGAKILESTMSVFG